MTNSTFVEGYDTSGALHYPAYTDDPRISHAHGWSTGPLLALTTFAAGLHVRNASSWTFAPQPGRLGEVEAGFTTAVGTFGARYQRGGGWEFWTPEGTVGTVVMEGVAEGRLRSANGSLGVPLVGGVAVGVPGGHWSLVAGNATGMGNATGGGAAVYTGAAAGVVEADVWLFVAVAGLCLGVML
ncbi:alpha-L-rhamnosidase A [Teratosphaeria destructans]|uniref:Alpha-L-rhamnosidase A n=1 Tax=Teratosphaeria destructans TaxID=418781 RepID=A0A9W7VZK5_9PEZI|nr:alpha-L-rhamnosidase A [Teratosphaeria destructans]